eukprot:g4417.t1
MAGLALLSSRVSACIFSKDRAFQLGELLRTLEASRPDNIAIDVTVLFAVSQPRFQDSYRALAAAWPSVTFLEEGDFQAQLREWLSKAGPVIMWGVDDIVVYGKLPLADAMEILDADADVFSYHLKLSPGIVYCHTANAGVQVPPLQRAGASSLVFERAQGSHDWRYPWDLCASIYRRSDAEALLGLMDSLALSYGHPNSLEANGHRAIIEMQGLQQQAKPVFVVGAKSACPDRPCMSVVTVNRVQDLYRNRVYTVAAQAAAAATAVDDDDLDALDDDDDDDDDDDAVPDLNGADLEALDDLLRRKGDDRVGLDAAFYRENRFYSVHIGDFRLAPLAEAAASSAPCAASRTADPLVSVVLPMYNAEEFVAEAVQSILGQTFGDFECIVVDDGSTDGSAAIVAGLAAGDSRVRLLRRATNGGIVAALKDGLAAARAPLIARMDADDISDPERLQRQVAYLRRNQDVDIVGTAVEIFTHGAGAGAGGAQSSRNDRVIAHPTQPAMVDWSMHFYCALAHPTVVVRCNCLEALGGYRDAHPRAEDYDLWLPDPPKPPPLKKEKEDEDEEDASESKGEEAAIDERLVAVLQDGAGAIPPPTGPEIERAIEVIEALRDDCLARWGGVTAAAEAVAVEEEDADSVRRRAACRAVQADAAGRRAELVTCAMSVEGPEAQRVWRKYGMQTVAALKGAA